MCARLAGLTAFPRYFHHLLFAFCKRARHSSRQTSGAPTGRKIAKPLFEPWAMLET
jgi:hypothetical protein